MKRIVGLLIFALVLLGSAPEHVEAGDTCPPITDSGGTPPCCASVGQMSRVRDVERRLMLDTTHEHVVFINCRLGILEAEFVGTLQRTQVVVNPFLSSNALVLHSHPLTTVPSVEDMQALHDLNPLEFWLIGYDQMAKVWLRCMFRKAGWLDSWPEMGSAEAQRIYLRINKYYAQAQGGEWARWTIAYTRVWSEWSAEHGIALTCERIT